MLYNIQLVTMNNSFLDPHRVYIYTADILQCLHCMNPRFTYFLSDLRIFMHFLLILRHTVSWLATRLRFRLTHTRASRVFTSQKAKMANRTSSGRLSSFRSFSTTEYSWDMDEDGERPWLEDYEFLEAMLIVFHASDKGEIEDLTMVFRVYSWKSWGDLERSSTRTQPSSGERAPITWQLS